MGMHHLQGCITILEVMFSWRWPCVPETTRHSHFLFWLSTNVETPRHACTADCLLEACEALFACQEYVQMATSAWEMLTDNCYAASTVDVTSLQNFFTCFPLTPSSARTPCLPAIAFSITGGPHNHTLVPCVSPQVPSVLHLAMAS